jgi:cytochrome c biogenesis protein CcmG/thiol:disulfide interchange protein DsbE
MAEPPHTESHRLSPAWMAAGAVALLVLALLAYALLFRPSPPPRAGDPVPELHLTAIDGTSIDLGPGQNSILVLNIFASWCAPCREEAAGIQRVWQDYQGQDVQFLGIAYKDAASKAQAFLDEFGVTYPWAFESNNHTARVLGVTGVPETFVIDRTGNLAFHFVGPASYQDLAQVLEQVLSQ